MQGKGPDDLDYICIVFPVVSTSLAEWLQYILDSNFICQLHEAAASHWRDPKMLKSWAVFLLELLSSPVLSQQLLMSPYCHVEELSGMKLAPDPPEHQASAMADGQPLRPLPVPWPAWASGYAEMKHLRIICCYLTSEKKGAGKGRRTYNLVASKAAKTS